MPSLYVIVPGFGGPHVPEKVAILRKNVAILRSFPWSELRITVCVYDARAILDIPPSLREDPTLHFIVQPGIVGQFLHAHATPEQTAAYDFVMLLLDDIELQQDVCFETLLRYHATFNMDIYSPSLTHDSCYQFEYMLAKTNVPYVQLCVTPACEAFCYFMPQTSYVRYYTHLEPHHNPWLWGLDMCLWKSLGMRCALLNRMTMKHHYKNECYELRPDADPVQGYEYTMNKYGTTTAELADQPAVLYYVIDTHASN
jgi:hypothetical protein